jgi:hypothetical protein
VVELRPWRRAGEDGAAVRGLLAARVKWDATGALNAYRWDAPGEGDGARDLALVGWRPLSVAEAGLAPGSLRLSPTALRSPPPHAFTQALARRADRLGRTALILAASERKIALFTALWSLSSRPEWGFAEHRCAFYPLNDIEEWEEEEGEEEGGDDAGAPSAGPTTAPPPSLAPGALQL